MTSVIYDMLFVQLNQVPHLAGMKIAAAAGAAALHVGLLAMPTNLRRGRRNSTHEWHLRTRTDTTPTNSTTIQKASNSVEGPISRSKSASRVSNCLM